MCGCTSVASSVQKYTVFEFALHYNAIRLRAHAQPIQHVILEIALFDCAVGLDHFPLTI